ncbi:MAG: uracil-DNA glycosylase [Terrestrivirus sp.]|uniref:Uracil-DNA glycosylase n=1 Tax=Terrestrivirus sp. TaxID=2487775 RepID=A0A3G4ZPY7_9VIRU|nr:MAG: uracil-DNA glycosylase [Terrestrivirus sp.]
MFSVSDYKQIPSWNETFPTNNVLLKFSDVHSSWYNLMKDIIESANIQKMEHELSEYVKTKKPIFPYPSLVLAAFKYTRYNDLKVVFVGQDPYFKFELGVPQAMGLAFSVPVGIAIPSSLDNIYKNMKKYGHITEIPKHGNLQFLANQGCLFLNTALTVTENEKNSHADIWSSFTDSIIVKLSNDNKNLVFVLWGAPAFEKFNLIDKKKHSVIVSSHPSGLSCNKPMKKFPAFCDNDHFGQINEYLKVNNKMQIIYGI